MPGCLNGAATCSGNALNAKDPRTGQIVTAPGAANSQALIGTPIPGSGNAATNGILQAGDGISKYSYTWPAVVFGPRFGYAYDLTGSQKYVLRGGGGWFYDRPDGNTVFSIPGNPPISTSQDLRNGQLSTLGTGLSPQPVPILNVFQYEAKVPSSVQWNSELQMALPWASAVTSSYVGNHGYNRLGAFQGGQTVNLNAVDFGAAYLSQNQDPTKAASAVPGANALTTNLLRPYRGLGIVAQQATQFWDTYQSLQFSLNRRYRDGSRVRRQLRARPDVQGQHRSPAPSAACRRRHTQCSRRSGGLRSAEREPDLRPNIIKANALWDLPKVPGTANGAREGARLHPERLADFGRVDRR